MYQASSEVATFNVTFNTLGTQSLTFSSQGLASQTQATAPPPGIRLAGVEEIELFVEKLIAGGEGFELFILAGDFVAGFGEFAEGVAELGVGGFDGGDVVEGGEDTAT